MRANFFTESILYWAVRGIAAASQRLPVSFCVAFGKGAGRAAYHLLPSRRALALGNLKAAFGDTYSHQEYEEILKRLFEHLGMTLIEVAWIPRMDEKYVSEWITIPPGTRERLEQARAQGKGAVLLTGHFGNWELGSMISALCGFPVLVLAREQGWPRLNRLLVEYRESKGCRVVTKGFPIRELIDGLRRGRIVGILSDQDGGRNGVLNPFFGRLASTAPGAIALGIKMKSPILPVFLVRGEGASHTLYLEEPLRIPEEGSLEEQVKKGLALYLQTLEKYVRRHPDQWLWLHRRWKSSPDRRVLLISDGKAGHDNQMRAFVQRMELAWEKKLAGDKRLGLLEKRNFLHVKKVEVRFRSRFWRAAVAFIAAVFPRRYTGGNFWLRLSLTPDSFRALQSSADIGISCGAAAAPVNLLWSRGIRARAVHLTLSRLPSWKRFDLSVIPRHDRLPKALPPKKTLLVDGAISPWLPDGQGSALDGWEKKLGLSKPKRIGLFLGGPTRGIPLREVHVRELLEGLLSAAEKLDAELLVTSSRRTPLRIEERLRVQLAHHPRCRLLTLVNRQDPGGLSDTAQAVSCILGAATHLVVSGDSISMVSEALASGKPVVSFLPEKNGFSLRHPKYQRFLEGLHRKGKLSLVSTQGVGQALLDFQTRNNPLLPADDPIVEYLTKWL